MIKANTKLTKLELQNWCKENLYRKDGFLNSNRLRLNQSFYKDNIEIFNQINDIVNIDIPLSKKCICLNKNIITQPLCYCGKNLKMISSGKFQTYCSLKCSANSATVRDSCNKTKLNDLDSNGKNMHQRIGLKNSHTSSMKTINEKIKTKLKVKATKLERYGDENYNNIILQKETYNKKSQHEKDEIRRRIVNTKINTIDDNGLNICQKTSIKANNTMRNDIDEFGENGHQRKFKKGLLTKINNGDITPSHLKDNTSQYYEMCDNLTNKSFHKYYYIINPLGLIRSLDYHLDHIYSKQQGYINNIPTWIISHPCNLQMLTAYDNRCKNSKCGHTIVELMLKIEEFNKLKAY